MRECATTACLLAFLSLEARAAELLRTVPLEKDPRQHVILKGALKFLNRQYTEKYPLAERLSPNGWFSVDLKPKCNLNVFSTAGRTCPVKFHHIESVTMASDPTAPMAILAVAITGHSGKGD